jgi:death-on-curing protein
VKKPLWLDEADAYAIHDRVIADHGGPSGVRDVTLLQSALARPQQHFAYSKKPTIIEMAALYIAGVVGNHPFLDGNKRTGFVLGIVFLELNGFHFTASEEDATQTILALAAGVLPASELTDWVAKNSKLVRTRA